MNIPHRFARLGVPAALASFLFLGAPAAAMAAPASSIPSAPSVTAASPALKGVGHVCQSALPSQAHDTLDLIDEGGPFPYPKDGTVFSNREGVLPKQGSGYYHEYTVVTPGSPDRGARRIVAGRADHEDFYSADHYQSFARIDFAC
ncbi:MULTISPECIES: ribonuclease domain-containing protein [Streptomyces]|uniref:ribonuclease domain-containing protein n=1 Tax=Streptomyces TaxID=1883 RepID=UPI00163B6F0A|nr:MULTISPECIES: ribonuclease [Streptomyces]MBC2877639.1 ribonuclease [Streptomyces sp. TYQ1024]UBI36130.1 ribonuclease [Streptomyces mobaraensis]UKW28725.1 ribonuclease [Streptomyces sp. TYQ1024]